jgi:hypothetical protein
MLDESQAHGGHKNPQVIEIREKSPGISGREVMSRVFRKWASILKNERNCEGIIILRHSGTWALCLQLNDECSCALTDAPAKLSKSGP